MEGICGTVLMVVFCLVFFPEPDQVTKEELIQEANKKFLQCVDRNVKIYHRYDLDLSKETVKMLCGGK